MICNSSLETAVMYFFISFIKLAWTEDLLSITS